MEFSDEVFEDFEMIRASGMCNMFSRQCVEEAAEILLDVDSELIEICQDRAQYPKLLLAFSSWKAAQR